MLMFGEDMRKLTVSVIFILVTLVVLVQSRRKRDKPSLVFRDCGEDPNRPVFFNDVRAHPIPVVTPGTLYISMSGNVTYTLPRRISLKLTVKKYFIGIPFVIPCFKNNIGSCEYENICMNLEAYEMRRRCPSYLRHFNLQCYCPFHQGEFSFTDLPLNIPKIRGYAGALVKVRGDYAVIFQILDEDKHELGCLDLQFSIKKRSRGWLFKI